MLTSPTWPPPATQTPCRWNWKGRQHDRRLRHLGCSSEACPELQRSADRRLGLEDGSQPARAECRLVRLGRGRAVTVPAGGEPVTQTGKTTRAQRMAMPLARDVVKDIAISHGGCIRPVQLRRTDLTTGETEQVLVPCGHTLASVCPACAERAKNLRAAQCREGWHLDREPDLEPDPPTDDPAMVDREPRRSPGPAGPGGGCRGGHRGPGPAARRTR